MYLLVKEGIITAYSRRNRMALIGDVVVCDDVIQENPWPDCELVYVPDSAWGDWLVESNPGGVFLRDGLRYPEDCPVVPTAPELAGHIDYVTQWSIALSTHNTAWAGEQIGILRDQMVQWGNRLGLEFTEDFTHLNEIAIAAIGAARIKKESP